MSRHIVAPGSLPSLSADISEDLRDAFMYYDKDDKGYIGAVHFKNILHNFGFHNMSKKDIDEELKKHQVDLNKKKTFDFDIIKQVITYRLMKAKGIDDEAKECFKNIDTRDKNYVTANDLKASLTQALDFPVTEQDINEFLKISGADDGHLHLNSFIKLYNS